MGKKSITTGARITAASLLLTVALVAFGGEAVAPAAEAPAGGFDDPGPCWVMRDKKAALLDRMFERDEFRIFYTLKDANALPDLTDRNLNGVPDRVEDVATQLVAAREIYSNVMGLTPPLQTPRYAKATAIDVFLVNMGAGGGTADEVINYSASGSDKGRCVLRINLHNGNSNKNVSPAHELFHLYQWGSSMFKPRWFMEGTARWSEHALLAAPAPEKPLPGDEAALERDFLTQVYAAGPIWNRLAILLDPVGRLNLPPSLRALTYLDGRKVVQDDELHGVVFMKMLFMEMEHLSLS
ncbi:MAG: hypothetical protein LBE78_12030, partial [Burkholderiaceae bacterium]|nr:hypothetical protein [Burkholderiaceae bacterium]